MAKLINIQTGRRHKPPRIVIYGTSGIGKTTFAASAQNPVFILTEDGLGEIVVPNFPLSKSFDDVMENISSLGTEENDYKTVVIDSADWLEPLIWNKVCEDWGVKNIEQVDRGFGKGYIYASKVWEDFTDALDWLRDTRGMTVIVTAHSKIKTFNDPENPPYDKYMLRLHDRASEHLKQWADIVLFATKKMVVSTSDGKTIARPLGRDGGERIMRCIDSPTCDAKNRYNLPEELPLSYEELAKAINNNRQGE